MPLAKLAVANDLTTRSKIKIGDRLVVPEKKEYPQLSRDFKRQLDRTSVKSGRWKYIVLHHTATPEGTFRGIDSVHRERHMENGIAYHFLIGNGRGMRDGETVASRRCTPGRS